MSREQPISGEARWHRVLHLLVQWQAPISADDGIDIVEIEEAEGRLGFRLPSALREWYQVAGRRFSQEGCQNHLELPHELGVEQEFLVFYLENQSVMAWGISLEDLDLDDPPVWIDSDYMRGLRAHDWVRETSSLTSIIYQMVIWEIHAHSEHGGWCEAEQGTVSKVEQHFGELTDSWSHWPRYPTRFFGNADALVIVDGADGVWVAGQTEEALGKAVSLLGLQLE